MGRMRQLILFTLVLYVAANHQPRIMPGCTRVGDHWICPTPKPANVPENCDKFGPRMRCVCKEVHNQLMCPYVSHNDVENCKHVAEGNIKFMFCDVRRTQLNSTSPKSPLTKTPTTIPPMKCKTGKRFIFCENYICQKKGKRWNCPKLPKEANRPKCEKFDKTMICPVKNSSPTTSPNKCEQRGSVFMCSCQKRGDKWICPNLPPQADEPKCKMFGNVKICPVRKSTDGTSTSTVSTPVSEKCHVELGAIICPCKKPKDLKSCPKLPPNADKQKCSWHSETYYVCPVKKS